MLRMGKKGEAKQHLLQSIILFPYIWSAWLELASLIERIEQVR